MEMLRGKGHYERPARVLKEKVLKLGEDGGGVYVGE